MEDKTKELETIKEVGKASVEAMLHAAAHVKPGVKLLDVANSTEKFLKEKNFGFAFPLNISINEQAAHYTPSFSDTRAFSEKDIVKIDFGAEKDGLLGDGAITVDLSGKNHRLVEASEKALDNALASVKAGVSVSHIGKTISDTIESMGFKPIKNLGGHGIETHDLHAGIFIPNYDNKDETTLEEDMIIAIEPFVTSGKGLVVESDLCEIYSYVADAQIRSPDSRLLLSKIAKDYSKEPFAVRWLSDLVDSKFRLYAAISELLRAGAIEANPVLVEVSGADVAQSEAQVLVTKEGCEVITRAKL